MSTTKPGSGTGRPERAGTRAKPICRRLFDLEQAADFAGVPVQAICRWIRMGKLAAYHLGGGRVRIDEVGTRRPHLGHGFRPVITSRQQGRIEPPVCKR
jgi:hypothetical protein